MTKRFHDACLRAIAILGAAAGPRPLWIDRSNPAHAVHFEIEVLNETVGNFAAGLAMPRYLAAERIVERLGLPSDVHP